MSVEEMFDVLNRYTKSVYKSLNKLNQQTNANFNYKPFEAVLLDNSFSRRKVASQKVTKNEDKPSSEGALDMIHVNVSQENVLIKDLILWDSQDTDLQHTLQFAQGMTQDFLEERGIQLSLENINGNEKYKLLQLIVF